MRYFVKQRFIILEVQESDCPPGQSLAEVALAMYAGMVAGASMPDDSHSKQLTAEFIEKLSNDAKLKAKIRGVADATKKETSS